MNNQSTKITFSSLSQLEISVSRENLLKEPELTESDPNNVRIYKESLFCDFKIETNDGEVFKAHKSFLAVNSPVFKAMLSHDTKELRNNYIKIKDINGKTMMEMLRFIYTGDIEDEKEVARDLLVAADKYQIEKLKIRCCDILVKEVTVQNAIEMILIADRVQNNALFQRGLDFISR
jgi:speckle-type POZ protein